MKRTYFFKTDTRDLAELIRASVGYPERLALIRFEREIVRVDHLIRGQFRRTRPNLDAWLAIGQQLTDIAEGAPARCRPALLKTLAVVIAEAEALVKKGSRGLTLEQRCDRLLNCRTKGVTPDARFAITLKSVDGDARRLAGRASSTAADRDQDVFSLAALKSMKADILGVPLFRDHRYGLNDVIGKVIASSLVKRGQETDLDVTLELLPPGSEGADQAWKLVESDVPIGLSVGVMVFDSSPRTGKGQGRQFDSVEIVDLSLVGIPSQRRATGLTPVKSVRKGSTAAALRYLKAWRASQTK